MLLIVPCKEKILLADHNSLIVPSRDSCRVFEDKNKAILEAREAETQILQKVHLDDAYICVHANPSDRQDPPECYTYGFGVGDEELSDTDDEDEELLSEPKNLRRIDRVQATPALRDNLSAAYTVFVARVDHKVVHVTCTPPTFDDTLPRFRCFEGFK